MMEEDRDANRNTALKVFLEDDKPRPSIVPANNTVPELFTYDPLPDEPLRTRILTLLGGDDMQPIQCTLRSVNLGDFAEQGIQYEALSYCWGSAAKADLVSIFCNGRRLNITRNLKMALNNLRPKQGERILWVDAICTNQEDKPECARQVPKMRDIYGRATSVVVWIGESNHACRGSFRVLEYLSKLHIGAQGTTMKFDEIKSRAHKIPLDGYPAKLSFNLAFAMVQVMEKAEWFSRVWVLQEVALAQSVSVMCGRQTITWDSFEKGMLVRALIAAEDRRTSRFLLRQLDVGVLRVVELRRAILSTKLLKIRRQMKA
ncbi:heterokaryon incompatibility protein-domain-containing protein [Podospora conica]|nr:heterokaryon incompatibility protein-domain-containing protein [Schizothecium conicum]